MMSHDTDFILREARRLLGELYGTFVLTFMHAFGRMAGQVSDHQVSDTASGISAGFILVGLIYSEGQVSGAHFNPAVTFSFALRGVFSWIRVPFYIIAQVAGSFIAASLLDAILGDVKYLGATTPQHISDSKAFGLETIFSLILIYTILNVAERGHVVGVHGAVPVGLVLSALTLIGGPLAGASMNPARSLGPAVLSGGEAIETYWIYVAAPFIGGIIAVILTFMLHYLPNPQEKEMVTGSGKTTQTRP